MDPTILSLSNLMGPPLSSFTMILNAERNRALATMATVRISCTCTILIVKISKKRGKSWSRTKFISESEPFFLRALGDWNSSNATSPVSHLCERMAYFNALSPNNSSNSKVAVLRSLMVHYVIGMMLIFRCETTDKVRAVAQNGKLEAARLTTCLQFSSILGGVIPMRIYCIGNLTKGHKIRAGEEVKNLQRPHPILYVGMKGQENSSILIQLGGGKIWALPDVRNRYCKFRRFLTKLPASRTLVVVSERQKSGLSMLVSYERLREYQSS